MIFIILLEICRNGPSGNDYLIIPQKSPSTLHNQPIIYQWNINGLTCDKLIDIQSYMLNESPDITVLTECWLKSVVSYNLDIKDYVLLNYPRSSMHRKAKCNSGGLVMYIKQYLYNSAVISKRARDRV